MVLTVTLHAQDRYCAGRGKGGQGAAGEFNFRYGRIHSQRPRTEKISLLQASTASAKARLDTLSVPAWWACKKADAFPPESSKTNWQRPAPVGSTRSHEDIQTTARYLQFSGRDLASATQLPGMPVQP
jgi:hypothetical protein